MEVSEGTMRILAGLLEARTGQQLGHGRRWRIETALRPLMQARGLSRLEELAGQLVRGTDPGLADTIVDALLNNETSFFRDGGAFALLDERALSRLHAARERTRRLRIWCAGCATGQEAYSLAMMIVDAPRRWSGWRIDIIATDLSNAALERARAGLYSQFEIQRGLPVRLMLRHFRKDRDEWRVDGALRRMIRFERHNLLDAPPAGVFDVILCRNVLLYFSADVRRFVFGRLASAIAPDGALILGAGETVIGNSDAFVSDFEARGLYRPRLEPAEASLSARTG